MQKRSVFNAEHGSTTTTLSKFLNLLSIPAYADEGENTGTDATTDDSTTPNQPPINFEQMIAQARKEEKDKLYPRLKKLEEENKNLSASVNKYLLENASLKADLEKQSESKDDSVLKSLQEEIETLKAENTSLKESTPNEEDIRKKIEEEFEVKMYIKDKLTENANEILSIFTSEVIGSTKEEVDEAIEKAKEKTTAVKKDLGLDKPPVEEKKEKTKKAPPATPPTDDAGEYDADYVRNLDPRSDEYKEFRKKMGLK